MKIIWQKKHNYQFFNISLGIHIIVIQKTYGGDENNISYRRSKEIANILFLLINGQNIFFKKSNIDCLFFVFLSFLFYKVDDRLIPPPSSYYFICSREIWSFQTLRKISVLVHSNHNFVLFFFVLDLLYTTTIYKNYFVSIPPSDLNIKYYTQ